MKELKKHTSFAQQVAILERRGLIITDHEKAEELLSCTNYYRLTGYLHKFKVPGTDRYEEGHSIEWLKRIYDFDRRFTRVLMYALEDIEETLKTRLSYNITSVFPDDPLIYLKPNIYREYTQYTYFLAHFYDAVDNNRELPFVKHHKTFYGGLLPMWVAVDLFTMGNLHAVYDNLLPKYQKSIAQLYKTGPVQLSSWIQNLTYTRNHLAHYMRVYNFNFGRTPARCKKHPIPCEPTGKIFDQICVMSFIYSDKIEWNNYILPELERVINFYSEDISLSDIGFPDDWKNILTITV